jgi:hypothetical protein
MIRGRTPNLTSAQLVAIAAGILAPVLTDLAGASTGTLHTVLLAAAGLASALILGDAHLRGQRARAVLKPGDCNGDTFGVRASEGGEPPPPAARTPRA